MVDERTLDLINADIDGELKPEESQELDAILEASADARAMRSELLRLSNLLDNQPAVNPPADLAQHILQQIKLPETAGSFSLSGLFSSFQPATAGLAFAAGLLATVSFYELTPDNSPGFDTAGMVGTMVANPENRGADVADSLSFSEPGVAGTVSLQSGKDVFALEFNLESTETVEIEVAFAEAGLGFGGIAHAVIDNEAADESYEISGGTLRVVNQGRQSFTVFLLNASRNDGGSREINIEVSSAGARVTAGVLRG